MSFDFILLNLLAEIRISPFFPLKIARKCKRLDMSVSDKVEEDEVVLANTFRIFNNSSDVMMTL